MEKWTKYWGRGIKSEEKTRRSKKPQLRRAQPSYGLHKTRVRNRGMCWRQGDEEKRFRDDTNHIDTHAITRDRSGEKSKGKKDRLDGPCLLGGLNCNSLSSRTGMKNWRAVWGKVRRSRKESFPVERLRRMNKRVTRQEKIGGKTKF